MRLENVVISTPDPPGLARWWAEALGAEVTHETAEEVDVNLPDRTPATGPWPDLCFVPGDRSGRQRVHLDLASASWEDQAATVARLETLGARPLDVGQPSDAHWVVMADPDGSAFCVVPPRPRDAGIGALAAINVAVPSLDGIRSEPPGAHPRAGGGSERRVVALWRAATGWELDSVEPGQVRLRRPDGTGPRLVLVERAGLGEGRDRWHLDVRPEAGDDRDEILARLRAIGARPLDVGQAGTEPWSVLADPAGLSFCVLGSA